MVLDHVISPEDIQSLKDENQTCCTNVEKCIKMK